MKTETVAKKIAVDLELNPAQTQMPILYEKYINPVFDADGRIVDMSYNVPSDFNFAYDVVDVLAKEQPTKKGLIWCNEQGDEKILTFSQLKDLSNKTANCLRSHGVAKGDRVMLIMGRAYQFWYTILALHKLGAVAVPCSNQLKGKDIAFRLERAKIRNIIITNNKFVNENVVAASKAVDSKINFFSVNGAIEGFYDFDEEIKNASSTFEKINNQSTDDLLMYFTSGTTSQPKGAMHNHLYPLGHIVTAKFWQNVTPDGIHFTVSDSGWGKAVWGKLYGQWLAETCVFVYDFERFNAVKMCDVIKKYKVTSFCAPPTIYRFMAKEGIDATCFESVKHIAAAGEPLNSEIFELFKENVGLEIMEGFGQTETTCLVGNFSGDTIKIGSMGRSSPQYDLVLLDEEDTEVKDGKVGEIAVRLSKNSIGIISSYFDDEKATKASFRNGYYCTGDLATKDADGYFYFFGRRDDSFKASGYRISPFEIESVLIEHDAVRECAIVGAKDEIRGMAIKACIVLTSRYQPSEGLIKELQQFVKSNAAPYKCPKIIEFYDELPKTASGKIMRRELRKYIFNQDEVLGEKKKLG